jgi:hypothetical protein
MGRRFFVRIQRAINERTLKASAAKNTGAIPSRFLGEAAVSKTTRARITPKLMTASNTSLPFR